MKFQPGFTDFFMSPVTGRIILPAFPDLIKNYVWIGDRNDRPIPSPIIIDLRLEIIDLRNRLSRTRFILQAASPNFDSSQALNLLIPGILKHLDGVVSIAIPGTDYMPVSLPYREIWLGNSDDIPTPVGRIWDDGVGNGNLPAYTPLNYKEIWRMNIFGIPVLSTDLTDLETRVTETETEITEINDEITTINETITEINTEIGDINVELGDIEVHLGDIDTHLGNIDTHLGDIDVHLGEIDTHLGDIDISIESILESIATITTDITGILDAIATINTQITSILDAITTINVTLGDLQAQIDANVASGLDHLADLQLQIDTAIASGNDHLATINTRLDSLEECCESTHDEIEIINSTLTDLQNQINTINTTITTILDDITTINTTLTSLQTQINTINTIITTIQSDITTINSTIVTMQSAITNITTVLIPAVYTYIDDAITNIANNFIAGGVIDMNDNRIINLPCDPVEDNDAISFCFLWHTLHDEVTVSWS